MPSVDRRASGTRSGDEYCYLCGAAFQSGEPRTRDHVVPSTLIRRAQPIAKGYDHAGVLPTHAACNNRFGDETYVSKALGLLNFLNSEDGAAPLQLKAHPEITILPLDESRLPLLTARDRRFFKIHDARDVEPERLADPHFFAGKTQTNLMRATLTTCLSVLAKSAAALLVKRRHIEIPFMWRIYAQPFTGDLSSFDLSPIVGATRPFDTELQAWVIELPDGNWSVVYAAGTTLIFFTFAFRYRSHVLRMITSEHPDAEVLTFQGSSLNQLLSAGWSYTRVASGLPRHALRPLTCGKASPRIRARMYPDRRMEISQWAVPRG